MYRCDIESLYIVYETEDLSLLYIISEWLFQCTRFRVVFICFFWVIHLQYHKFTSTYKFTDELI